MKIKEVGLNEKHLEAIKIPHIFARDDSDAEIVRDRISQYIEWAEYLKEIRGALDSALKYEKNMAKRIPPEKYEENVYIHAYIKGFMDACMKGELDYNNYEISDARKSYKDEKDRILDYDKLEV